MTNIFEVIAIAGTYLSWLITQPLKVVWCDWRDGVFIGAVRTDMMQHTVLIASLLVFLPIWCLTRDWGSHDLWFACTLFLAVRGIGLLVAYQRFSRKEVWLQQQPV